MRKVSWPLVLVVGFVGWAIGKGYDDTVIRALDDSGLTDVSLTDIVGSIPPKQDAIPVPQRRNAPVNIVPTGSIKSTGIQFGTMYVDAERLNVRAGPSTESRQVWTLKRNDRVTITAAHNDWRHIEGERFSGWVHGEYLIPWKSPNTSLATIPQNTQKPQLSDSQIRIALINRSIALYRGACPCPYNVMRNGRRCGGDSAYSSPGVASPLCYERDITAAMIADYRARQ